MPPQGALSKVSGVHPELRPYLGFFGTANLSESQRRVLDTLSAGFVTDMNSGVADEKNLMRFRIIGMCAKFSDGRREIWIDDFFWSLATEEARLQLMLHELGHCVLDRGHDHENGTYKRSQDQKRPADQRDYESNGYLWDGCPMSVMYPSQVSDLCFSKHNDAYLRELMGL
jgi:hypothetical protein